MKTKIELIDRAYSKLRISGITVNPTTNDIILALDEMECMIAEWEMVNVCLGYNQEDEPEPNSESGLVRGYENAVQTNLAVRIAPEFGKISGELAAHAAQSYSKISSAVSKVKAVPYPNRQPIGESNTLRFNQWSRFYYVDNESPNDCSTEIMVQDDIVDGKVSYNDYLIADDEIASFTTKVSSGLELISSSDNGTDVEFRVKATGYGSQKLTLTIVTNEGLQKTSFLWYSVTKKSNR